MYITIWIIIDPFHQMCALAAKHSCIERDKGEYSLNN